MTKEKLEAIRQAMTVLPEKFIFGQFYDTHGNYCWWGWLGKRFDFDPAKTDDMEAIWDQLRPYGLSLDTAFKADDQIKVGHSPEEVTKYMLGVLEREITA